MENNYLVSVFIDGRNVHSYFSSNLDDLVTVKALYPSAEIQIFDLNDFTQHPASLVTKEIYDSGIRWKRSIETQRYRVEEKSDVTKPKKVKEKKKWERPVLCIETGQYYCSIRECSEHTGIPYMTIVNCIKNGNATRGVHFVNMLNE